jgi:hypothetical protein
MGRISNGIAKNRPAADSQRKDNATMGAAPLLGAGDPQAIKKCRSRWLSRAALEFVFSLGLCLRAVFKLCL